MHVSLRSILILSSHLRLGLPEVLFPVGLPFQILKVLLSSSILATWPDRLNLRSTLCHPSWAQIIASGPYFQMSLACVFPLISLTYID